MHVVRVGVLGVVFLFLLSAVAVGVGTAFPSSGSSERYVLVAFVSQIQPEWREYVMSLGGLILGYLPPDTYIVRIDEAGLSRLTLAPFVRSLELYATAHKISKELYGVEGEVPVSILVFREGKGGTFGVADRIKALGAVVEEVTDENYMIKAKAPAALLPSIAEIPQVQWIGIWGPPVRHMDNVRSYTGAEYLRGLGYDGSSVVGEVMDDGLDQSHPEFVNRILGVQGNPPAEDHGTSTFGIAFSRGDDAVAEGMLSDNHPPPPTATGVFAWWGVSRTTAASNLVNTWGGVFQSHSWSRGEPEDRTYSANSQENDWIVLDYDITMTQSMGNSGFFGWGVRDAMAKNLIAVGGVAHLDDADRTNDFHTQGGVGPATDGRIRPDLAGPEDNVYTTVSGGGYHADFGGTSAAAPVVAGSAGLVYQLYRDNAFGNNPSGVYPHASTVKALLIANAYQYDLDTQASRCEQGWGTPDLQFMYGRRTGHLIVDEAVSLQQGAQAHHQFLSESNEPLKVSLVWTDYPATPDPDPALKRLVNDLDLVIVDPLGNLYRGNFGLTGDTSQVFCPGASQWSLLGGTRDTLNNVENVFVQVPAWGMWNLWVQAKYIPMDGDTSTPENDQPFSLVVSSGAKITDTGNPDPTALSSPPCSSLPILDERPTFSWSPFSDPSPSSGLKWFHFELGTDSSFAFGTLVVHDHPRTNSYASAQLNPGTYYWRVKAEDNAGNPATQWSTPTVCQLVIASPAVNPPGSLSISRVTPDTVRLSWNPVPGVDGYRVYESQDRFAAYGAWNFLGTTTATTFDAPHLTDGLTHYYVVRSLLGASESRASTMAAKTQLNIPFDASRTNIYWFSLPYRSEYTKASDIANELASAKVDVVGKWNPATQNSIVWYYRDKWRGTDFSISPGDGLYVGSVSAFSWVVVGTDQVVSLQFAVNPPPVANLNWRSLPYTSRYIRASDLVFDIEGGVGGGANTKIVEIRKWDGESQDAVYILEWTPTGWVGSDFVIGPGESVLFRIVASFTWQPKLVTPEVP